MTWLLFQKTIEHLFVSLSALILALCIALPLGFYLSRVANKRLSMVIIRMASLIQTIPGLAMIALIIVLLVSLRSVVHLPTTGYLPGILALSLYAISPILTNTYTGITQANRSLIDVGTGLGMSKRQILFLVEAPHAIPTIMAGIRIAGVWTLGMCTLTSLVGAGGLGDLIFQGLRSINGKYLLAGTLPSAFLAVAFEWGMTRLEHWLKVDFR